MRRALERAITEAGGISALARAINVTRQTVHNWINRGQVSIEYALPIQEKTGVSSHDLRPDIFGEAK